MTKAGSDAEIVGPSKGTFDTCAAAAGSSRAAQWTEQEFRTIVKWHGQVGANWVTIAQELPGRSPEAVEQFWNQTCRWRSFSPAERLATVIGRRWRLRSKHRSRLTLDRAEFLARLLLEIKLQTGLWRLLLFTALFLLIVIVTRIGTPSIERRAVGKLLDDSLRLPEFRELKRLEDVRDYLPRLSRAIKRFSASSSARYKDANAWQLLGAEVSFAAPVPLVSLDLPVTRSFTLTAWVRDDGVAKGEFLPLLRKPLSTDPTHNCWGWFYPAAFRYGAHDFHSVDMLEKDTWEEIISGPPKSWERRMEEQGGPGGAGSSAASGGGRGRKGVGTGGGRVTHEALVVKNDSVSFYRDGVVLVSRRLQRAVTDCVGGIEMGGQGVTASSIKFYPRALQAYEIREVYTNGQPLSEIATGSELQELTEDRTEGLRQTIEQASEREALVLDDKAATSEALELIRFQSLQETRAQREDFLYSFEPDTSPCTFLWSAEAQGQLPAREKLRWQQCAIQSSSPLHDFSRVRTGEWRQEGGACGCGGVAVGGSVYYSLFDTPVYALAFSFPFYWASNWPYVTDYDENLRGELGLFLGADFQAKAHVGEMPLLSHSTTAVTVTFWIKALMPDEPFAARIVLTGNGMDAFSMPFFSDRTLSMTLFSFGDAAAEYYHYGSWRYYRQTEASFATRYPSRGPLDQSFFLTNQRSPRASTWRFMAWQVDFKQRTAKTFWDGRLASTVSLNESRTFQSFTDVSEQPQSFPDWATPSLFSGAKFFIDSLGSSSSVFRHTWGDRVGRKDVIKSKVAQMRIYPEALNEDHLLRIQAQSTWLVSSAQSTWCPPTQSPCATPFSSAAPLTQRGPQNATFAQATAACAAQGRVLVTAANDDAVQLLLDRAGTDLESLSWVGAQQVASTGKWQWPEAQDGRVLWAEDFWQGLTCHQSAQPMSLAEAQQVCRSQGMTMVVPHDYQYATQARIQVSCPGFAGGGCRFCNNAENSTKVLQTVCYGADGVSELGVVRGNFKAGLASEEACVVAGGLFVPQTAGDLQAFWLGSIPVWSDQCHYFKFIFHSSFAPGVCKAATPGMLSRKAARDAVPTCPPDYDLFSGMMTAGSYRGFQCCPKSDVCLPASVEGTYSSFFCLGNSSYQADMSGKCLAVLAFNGKLQFVPKDCSERLSYVCQDKDPGQEGLQSPSSAPAREAGAGGNIKQCEDEEDVLSNSFVDTADLDEQGHSCAWYAKMKTTHPLVCSSNAAKKMCPVTCGAKQVCFSRTPASGREATDATVYRIFDRVMHLRPKDSSNPTSVICPRSSIDQDKLIRECRACQGSGSARCTRANYSDISDWQFRVMYNSSWSGYQRANILSCAQLQDRLDPEQCAWNDSFVEPFVREFNKSNVFSLSFWSKPVSSSRGMPREFSLSLNFFAKLVSPKTLFDIQEAHPYNEALTKVEIANVVSETWLIPQSKRQAGQNNMKLKAKYAAEIRHGGAILFHKEWTFYHISFMRESFDSWEEVVQQPQAGATPRFVGVRLKKVVETWRMCLSLNAIPRQCSPFELAYFEPVDVHVLRAHPDWRNGNDIGHPFAELRTTFFDAFEVTAEVLLSPIDVVAKMHSASKIQQIYFKQAPRMRGVIGPRVSESQRLAARKMTAPKQVETFPERILLGAPPLLFQQRRNKQRCNMTAMQTFLEQQLELVKASHCRTPKECPSTTSSHDIYQCSAGAAAVQHFGLNATKLSKATGFADFLYTMADNEVIVRNDVVLPAREFLDTETDSAKIITLFYSPNNGDTTVLTLSVQIEGSSITTYIETTFFGFLDRAERAESGAYYIAIVVVSAAILVLSLSLLLESRALTRKFLSLEEHRPKTRLSLGAMELRAALREENESRSLFLDAQRTEERQLRRGVYFDVLLVLLVLAFCLVAFVRAQASQANAEILATQIAKVPWSSPTEPTADKIATFFDAIEILDQNLVEEQALFYVSFGILLLLLNRMIAATAIHPRLGILIITLHKGADGLSHFAVIFTLVFLSFSVMSWWSFGHQMDDFKDLSAAMTTQFILFTFNIPPAIEHAFKNPQENIPLVMFAVLTVVLESIMMCNFLIAIVLESFIEAQADYKDCDVELTIFQDIVLLVKIKVREVLEGWPSKRRLVGALMHEIATRNVAWWQLVRQDDVDKDLRVTPKVARSIFTTYYGRIDELTDEPLERDNWQSHLRARRYKEDETAKGKSDNCNTEHERLVMAKERLEIAEERKQIIRERREWAEKRERDGMIAVEPLPLAASAARRLSSLGFRELVAADAPVEPPTRLSSPHGQVVSPASLLSVPLLPQHAPGPAAIQQGETREPREGSANRRAGAEEESLCEGGMGVDVLGRQGVGGRRETLSGRSSHAAVQARVGFFRAPRQRQAEREAGREPQRQAESDGNARASVDKQSVDKTCNEIGRNPLSAVCSTSPPSERDRAVELSQTPRLVHEAKPHGFWADFALSPFDQVTGLWKRDGVDG